MMSVNSKKAKMYKKRKKKVSKRKKKKKKISSPLRLSGSPNASLWMDDCLSV